MNSQHERLLRLANYLEPQLAADLREVLQQLAELEARKKDLAFYRKRRGELVIERDRARDLLRDWLKWYEKPEGSKVLDSLESDTRAELQQEGEG